MIAMPQKSESAFTIIEMVIVIFIISVALVSVYSAFSLMIVLGTDAFDQLQAAYLSQEGVEIVHNIRNSNWLAGFGIDPGAWAFGLADEDKDCSQGCELDYTTDPLESRDLQVFANEGNYLNIDPNGFYSYSTLEGSRPTKFKRKVTIEPLTGDTLKVTVRTFWNEKPNAFNPSGEEKSVTVTEILYNWY